ncbi:MAG TPA: hypothetical protein VFO98_12985 [Marmoricola sp.]|nr:hypothetical protein [Marmoricola sp.]
MTTRRERRDRRRRIAAVALALALASTWIAVRWLHKDDQTRTLPTAPQAVVPQPGGPSDAPPVAGPGAGHGAPGGRPAHFGALVATGLPGGSRSVTIGRHHVVLRAWSRKPMAFTAWYVPTRQGAKRGGTRRPGSSWSMATTAYGPPDYAQLYLQTDVTGEPVHCSITVDGEVTARETTEGPYGTIMCQG